MIKNIIKRCLGSAFPAFQAWYWRQMAHFVPKTYSSIRYKNLFHKELSWEHPRDINEKIQWLKFNSDTLKWSILADKYRVREYVEEKGLGHMLVKLYGKWNKAADIDWDSLPQKFVMKVNSGSGDVMICQDKAKIDKAEWCRYFDKLLHEKFGYVCAEPHYNSIKPCIIAEELLDVKQQQIESTSLVDYKIWCFDGKPSYVWACFNRTKHSVEVMVYDLEWQKHPEFSVSTEHYILAKQDVPRPLSLDEILNAAAKLSEGFPELRIDFYEVGEKPYFGEMTFSSMGGLMDFYTTEFLNILGDKTILPTDNKG